MMTIICLRVIEGLPRPNQILALSIILAANGHRDFEQIGVELQLSGLGSLEVDLEANGIVLEQEVNHSALVQKVIRLANGQNGYSSGLFHQVAQLLSFGVGNEKDVASAEFPF